MYVTQEVRSSGCSSFVHHNEWITKDVCNTTQQLISIDFIDFTDWLTANRTNDILEDYSASNMDAAAKGLQIHNVDVSLLFHTWGVLVADILA